MTDLAQKSPLHRLAKAILLRAAKDMKPSNGVRWLDTEACKALCEQAAIEYRDYVDAVKFILDKPDAQRTILLHNLQKNLGA